MTSVIPVQRNTDTYRCIESTYLSIVSEISFDNSQLTCRQSLSHIQDGLSNRSVEFGNIATELPESLVRRFFAKVRLNDCSHPFFIRRGEINGTETKFITIRIQFSGTDNG